MTSSKCGLLDGEVAGLRAFEKAVDVARGISKLVKDTRAKAHQSTRLRKLRKLGSHWHSVPLAELDNPCPIGDLNGVLRPDDGRLQSHRGLEALLKIVGDAQLETCGSDPEVRGGRLCICFSFCMTLALAALHKTVSRVSSGRTSFS